MEVFDEDRAPASIPLVGSTNETDVMLGGVPTRALLDTGSMVTTVSKDFYDSYLKDTHPLLQLDSLLTVRSAGGTTIPFHGYIEANFACSHNGLVEAEMVVPVLVMETTDYHESVPMLVGTNVISRYIEELRRIHGVRYLQKITLNGSWFLAYKSMNNQPDGDGLVGIVKSSQPTTVPPGGRCLTTGVCKTAYSGQVMVEPCEPHSLPGGLLVTTSMVGLESNSTTASVQIELTNLSEKYVIVPEKTILCQLVQVTPVFPSEMSAQISKLSSTESTSTDDFLKNFDLNHLEAEEQDQAKTFLTQWSHVFAQHSLDLGHTDKVKHHIHLNDDIPFKDKYRTIPPSMYEEVRRHIQEMLDMGAIRESESPYSSNVVLAKKKDGTLRFCIDLRRLNSKTIRDSYALPRIEETLNTLAGARWFSTLDLKSGYWQVEVAEEDKHKTAFTVGNIGFYECNRMAFGLTNAPATFQRLMERCLHDISRKECCIFLDDVAVFSDTFEEMLVRLSHVMQRLESFNLKLKPSKCSLFKKEITYLGHRVSAEGISTDPEKVSAIVNYPKPSTQKELQSFLGLAGYYRRYICNFSKIARPLQQLINPEIQRRKGKFTKQTISWTQAADNAFEELKVKMSTPPILGFADFNLPFEVHTDASIEGLGAVLYQQQESGQRVIAYASRGLSKSERNYPAHKLEFLALKWAVCEKFHDYLYGSKFEVKTDNNPLTYVLTTAKLDATGHRWLAELANYDFNIQYRPGSRNQDADSLSRIPRESIEAICQAVKETEVVLVESLSMDAEAVPEPRMDSELFSHQDWTQAQSGDRSISIVVQGLKSGEKPVTDGNQELTVLLREWDKLVLFKDVLVRQRQMGEETCVQVVVPASHRTMVLEQLHDKFGHFGIDRTLELVRERFYWPNMAKDVEAKVKTCLRCICRKAHPTRSPLVNIKTSFPMELVCIDFLTMEPSKGGVENVLVVTDHFTRYAQAFPTKNQTAKTTAKNSL